MAVLSGAMAFPQYQRNPGDPEATATPVDPVMQKIQIQAAIARNLERQKTLVSDTQQLLKLANELNDAVNKSNANTLSLDVIKKAEEIEKLAKQVKEKMKGD